ncbi:hypothetical protein J4408_03355 [Candidatus Pacearchaeota archaeon]|nr:hypothetical protein [Candidatus Pacearchaeota archaeon]
MLVELIFLALAVPVGFLIVSLTEDELKEGKKWFRIIFVVSIVLAALCFVYGWSAAANTLVFMAIVAFVSILKGK